MINIKKGIDLDFDTDYCTINYRIDSGQECFIEYDQSDKKVCFIDYINIIETENRGKGLGKKALEEFISEIKKTGIKKFYLFAVLEVEELGLEHKNDEEKLVIFHKIISMYSKCGFSSEFSPSYWTEQVDMYL